ncbi:MAG: histidine kinase [Acidobacteria bacterium]|nr:histidine kinase [Acidobacteriota bacterium]
MHPILANPARLRLYLISWVPMEVLLTWGAYGSGVMTLPETLSFILPLLTLYSLFCLSSWYLCNIMPLSRTAPGKLVVNHFAAASAMGAFWVLLAVAWAWALSRFFPAFDTRIERFYPLFYVAGVLLYLLTVALHYLLSSVESSQQAQTLARESQLKALKMQVNPHFLFNSLNSISALAVADGKRAREMCIKLSDFLRTTLQLGDRESIPLQEERALCLNYLEVERVRFGSRLTIEQSIDEACGQCHVPSLIVQPLVENAMKHGISGISDSGIVRIEARCGKGILVIRVSNAYDPEYQPRKGSGIGLVNVRQRLHARYGDQGKLEVARETSNTGFPLFRAEIRMPCGDTPANLADSH